MTKEELKKEAIKYAVDYPTSYGKGYKHKDLRIAYLAGAEPREKRIAELIALINAERKRQEKCDDVHLRKIAELEKENAELKLKLKTAYRKGMRHMAKALKDYDRTDGVWTDYFEHTVDKVLQREQLDFEEYGTLADQLTKAKKIIQRLVTKLYKYTRFTDDVLAEAEQFLNEVEK